MNSALRKAQHQLGRQHLRNGNYQEALAVMQGAMMKFGPHVGLLADIVASQYFLGRMSECRSSTDRLESELSLAQEVLSSSSFVKTAIFLGKMLEERGEVAKALHLYDQACILAEDANPRMKSQCQLLRLKSFLGQKRGLSDLYLECAKFHANLSDLDIELEHALMLAEACLFGFLSAEKRLQILFARHELVVEDRRLLIIDFAEALLLAGQRSALVTEMIDTLPRESLDAFEKLIVKLYREEAVFIDPAEINDAVKSISTMCFLRISMLCQRLQPANELTMELKRRFVFFVSELTAESQNKLTQKWRIDSTLKKSTLRVASATRVVNHGSHEFKLKLNSFGHRCFFIFKNRQQISFDEFVREVFEGEPNFSYQDRARIALQRLNKEISQALGVAKTFVYRKDAIFLEDAVEIHFE